MKTNNINNIFLILVLACTVSLCKAAAGDSAQQMWVKGNDIRLRAGPTVDSAVVAVLQGGFKVTTLETVPGTQTIAGRQGSWRKVSFRGPDYNEKVGYVFDAFLVTDADGPPGLEERAYKLSENSPREAIKIYKQILAEFPQESEIALFPRKVWISNRVATIECWAGKKSNGGTTKAELIQLLRKPTEGNNRSALLELASCTFLQWDSPCAGDPLPGPASHADIDQYLGLAKDFAWDTAEGDCIITTTKNLKYCFSIEEQKSRYFWSGGCIERKQ